MCDTPRKRQPNDKNNSEQEMSSDSSLEEQENGSTCCITCGVPTVRKEAQEHPFHYGYACSECLLACKNLALKWSSSGSFQCENCSGRRDLTILKHRLLCFECLEEDEYPSSPKIRFDWMEKILSFRVTNCSPLSARRPLRVLSMFDGIGTGLLALDKLGLKVEKYFSCEIDDAALAVLNFRFYGRITHLGSVSNLTAHKLRSLGHIDLLLGGSPCNELSLANPLRKGLYDARASGILFFDFNRVLKFLQASAVSEGKVLFWLYENVAAMPHDFRTTISKTLNCNPARWDGIQFLPAKRARLFWGNIPNLHCDQKTDQPSPCLDDILEPYRKAVVQSLPTLTTTFHSQTSGKEMQLPVIEDGNEDGLLITERERLFGFPSHFTDGPDLSINQRQSLLGRAWSVPVIERILSPLTELFELQNE